MLKIKLEESYKLIQKDFSLENPSFLPQNMDSLEELKKLLRVVITDLLEHNFERLVQIMYRLDIDEQKFNTAFSMTDIPAEIAELVIHRELEKVQTRLKYRDSL